MSSHYLKALITLIRPHQWIKNIFVVAPLFFTPEDVNLISAFHVFLGFLCFCAISSAVYVMNDYMDRHTDALHPVKCKRPLASGAVTSPHALLMFLLLLFLGFGGGILLNYLFALAALGYFSLNVAYCFYLKNHSIIDILSISFGFLLRIVAGAVLINESPSVWIMVCSLLLALFIAIAKRRDDIVTQLDSNHRKSLQGYTINYIDTCMAIVLSALLLSYTIYTTDAAVMEKMSSKHVYLTVPFVFAGILRYLQITLVEERSGSPTRIVYSDKFLFLTLVGWVATNAILIYL